MITLAAIDAIARRVGLRVRGGFGAVPDDGLPPLGDGRPVRTVVLLGNVGSSLWPAFSASPEHADGAADPLDRWSRRVTEEVAGSLGAGALYPFGGPPHWPFQRWAQRAEAVHPSPLGLLIHPDHGLWHAYRSALLFADALDLAPPDRRPSPCAACPSQPCLAACPVGAFDGRAYDVAACAAHIAQPGGHDCMTMGCRARRACPVGAEHAYQPALARFHMTAFQRARTAAS